MFADLPDRRRVLIDSATREGMSGAPVVARSIGGYLHENGAFTLGEGISTRPIGVYSGRLATQDDMDAQIGIVWPFPLIERIMDSGVMDTFELNGAFKAQAPVQ
jgi:hypothetical protein